MTYWPYHEWLADCPDELHLYTTPAKLDLPEPERSRVLSRYASVNLYDNIERNARPLLDIADLARRKPLRALVAQVEWDIGWSGAFRDRYRIPGQDGKSALAYKNKVVMKGYLRAAGIPVTHYRKVDTILDIYDHAKEHGFPVVVKPSAAGGALGVVFIDNREQLDALAEPGLAPRIETTPDLMVESFIEGRQYIVDGLVLEGKLVFAWPSAYIGAPSDYHSGGRHLAAVMLDADHPLRAQLQEMTRAVIEALPSPPTFPFHAEFYHTPDDRLVFGEIASRTGGARIDDMYQPIFGIESLNRAWVRYDAGLDPGVPTFDDVEKVRANGVAGWITFSPQPGLVRRLPPTPPEPWVGFRLTASPGMRLNQPVHSGDFFASAVVIGPSNAEVETRIIRLADWFWNNTDIAGEPPDVVERPVPAARATDQRALPQETNPVRIAAFHLLFDTGKPVEAERLARELGLTRDQLEIEVADLEKRGLIKLEGGRVVGAVGLSVVPSSSRISVQGREFWVWCARTAVGVLAGLGQGGEVIAKSPYSGRELRLRFSGARPEPNELAIFWPGSDFVSSCGSAVDELCPNINFFESREAAESWARDNGARGEVLSVDEVIALSVGKWGPLLADARKKAQPAVARTTTE
jgi:alkylmercury lyase-like protein/carbamoyl-phosphate synthase L subunit-like protein